jgi:hypothetical protein
MAKKSNNITLPIGMSFEKWSSQIINDLPELKIPVGFKVEKWWDWVSQLIQLNNLSNVLNANKIVFKNEKDWKVWAAFFCNTILEEKQ